MIGRNDFVKSILHLLCFNHIKTFSQTVSLCADSQLVLAYKFKVRFDTSDNIF